MLFFWTMRPYLTLAVHALYVRPLQARSWCVIQYIIVIQYMMHKVVFLFVLYNIIKPCALSNLLNVRCSNIKYVINKIRDYIQNNISRRYKSREKSGNSYINQLRLPSKLVTRHPIYVIFVKVLEFAFLNNGVVQLLEVSYRGFRSCNVNYVLCRYVHE